jgi:hypothetical protein
MDVPVGFSIFADRFDALDIHSIPPLLSSEI